MPPKYFWPIPSSTSKYKVLWDYWSLGVISVVGVISKIWMSKLNNLRIHNEETFFEVLHNRREDTALLTVSNHFSCLDEPLLWGCLKWQTILQPQKMRWVLAAHDICFTRKTLGRMLALGRVVPVVRGGGVYQRGVDFVINKMNEGGWSHIFPEGKINMTKNWIRFKWGVGRMVYDCRKRVIVLPLYHYGMDEILPNKYPYIPRVGHNVTVLIGDPMEFHENINEWKLEGWNDIEIRKGITDQIQVSLEHLRIMAAKLHNDEFVDT